MRPIILVICLIFLFGFNKTGNTESGQSVDVPFEVQCSEPLPVFTLGYDSNPSEEQVKTLCKCVWENLGKWERDVSVKLSQGRESEISEIYIKAFSSRFGSAIKKCGGMNF